MHKELDTRQQHRESGGGDAGEDNDDRSDDSSDDDNVEEEEESRVSIGSIPEECEDSEAFCKDGICLRGGSFLETSQTYKICLLSIDYVRALCSQSPQVVSKEYYDQLLD